MLRLPGQNAFQGGQPAAFGLIRQGIHEVNAEIVKPCFPGQFQSLSGLSRLCRRPRNRNSRSFRDCTPRLRRLTPRSFQERSFLRSDIVWVGLQGDFGLRGQHEILPEEGEKGGHFSADNKLGVPPPK